MKFPNNLPLVSFVIPTLNAEKYLPHCLDAITKQEYPRNKIEIIIADAYSTDKTRKIAKKYNAKLIDNPEILHEPGKTLGTSIAKGKIIFYTDSDNVLSHKQWIMNMVAPYLKNRTIKGFLPQTIPAPDSNSLDRYLGYLCTDPFTWFVYEGITSGRDFPQRYKAFYNTKDFALYKFKLLDPPLFGLSQGAGSSRAFSRGKIGHADDLLAAIKIIKEHGIVAYVPSAGVYHYHVSGLNNYIKKYRWRIRNNLSQRIKGMGIVNRQSYFSTKRKIRMRLFVFYGLSLIFPLYDSILLFLKYKDKVMFWHTIASFTLAVLIIVEYLKSLYGKADLGTYE